MDLEDKNRPGIPVVPPVPAAPTRPDEQEAEVSGDRNDSERGGFGVDLSALPVLKEKAGAGGVAVGVTQQNLDVFCEDMRQVLARMRELKLPEDEDELSLRVVSLRAMMGDLSGERSFIRLTKESESERVESMNRLYRDTVLHRLLRKEKYMRAFHYAVHPEDGQAGVAEVAAVPLDRILTAGWIHNDGAILVNPAVHEDRDVHGKVDFALLEMFEAQSAIYRNVPWRMSDCLMETLHWWAAQKKSDQYRGAMHGAPCPEMYAIYTGPAGKVPSELKLSEMYQNPGFFEPASGPRNCTVHVLTLRDEDGTGCDTIIDEYIRYCRTVDRYLHDNRHSGNPKPDAVVFCEAIQECIARGYLAEFFRETRGELGEIMRAEVALRVYEDEMIEAGRDEIIRDSLPRLMKLISLDEAMDALGVPADRREKYREMVSEQNGQD